MHFIQVPPVRDHHTHIGLFASLSHCLDLADLDRSEALAQMHALPSDRLNTVYGWHSGRVPLAPADLADLPPILLINLSLHSFLLTPSAVERVRDVEPEILERKDDPVWCEQNMPRLLAFFGRSARLEIGKFSEFMTRMEAMGVNRVDELLLQSQNAWEVMQESRWGRGIRYWTTPRIFHNRLSPEAKASISGFKVFLDGALGASTAALREGFLDGQAGLLIYRDDELDALLGSLQGLGPGLAIHAIGERAIDQALGSIGRLHRAGPAFPQVRLEHAQLITEPQARLAKDLGVHLSMQPNFSEDSLSYQDRLGAEILARNNPFRMLIDRVGFLPGKDLVFGSDGMPFGLQAQLQWGLFPPAPGQVLRLEELLDGLDAASEGPCKPFRIDPDARRVTPVEG